MPNPDKIVEQAVLGFLPIWGPVYAIFYLARLVWKELKSKKERA